MQPVAPLGFLPTLAAHFSFHRRSASTLDNVDGPLPGSNDKTTFVWNTSGTVASATDSEGYALSYVYDNFDRLTKTTFPDGTTEQTVYQNLDPVFSIDRLGRTSQYTFDAMDQMSSAIDPLGRKTQYSWCSCGSLATLTDGSNNVTTWTHDLEGRTRQKIYADNTAVSYLYEADTSRLAARTDAMLQTTFYNYALDNSLTQKTYPLRLDLSSSDATTPVLYSYDSNFPRLSGVTNGWGTIKYAYNNYVTDPFSSATTGGGRLQSVTNNVIPNSAITYAFDAMGRVANRSINGSANSTAWEYDLMGRVASETNALGRFQYNYVADAAGLKGTTRLSYLGYPNGQTTRFSWYNNRGDQRLSRIENLAPIAQSGTLSMQGSLFGALASNTRLLLTGPDGLLIAAGSAGNNILLFDSTTRVQVANINIGNTPGAMALSKDKGKVYVASPSGNFVAVVDLVSSTLASTISLSTSPLSLAVSPDGKRLFVGTSSGTLRVDTATNSVISGGTVSSFRADHLASFDDKLISLDSSTTTLRAFQLTSDTTYTALNTATVGSGATEMLFDPATKKIFVANGGSNTVSAVDSGSLIPPATASVSTISGFSAPSGLSLSGPSLFVADGSSAVKQVNTGTLAIANSISMSASPARVASAPAIVFASSSSSVNYFVNNATISNFAYGENSAGEIVEWDQLQSGRTAGAKLEYDQASQLVGMRSGVGATPPPYVDQHYFSYDAAANRTAAQKDVIQYATVGGTVTNGDIISLTVQDSALSGGSRTVSYTVSGSPSFSDIATYLAALVTADSNLQTVGISATALGSKIVLRSLSNNVTSYSYSQGSNTESIAFGITKVTGNIGLTTAGPTTDTVRVRVFDPVFTNGFKDTDYTTSSGQAAGSIAAGLASALSTNLGSQFSVTQPASSSNSVVQIVSNTGNISSFVSSYGRYPIITAGTSVASSETVLLGGTPTNGDKVYIEFSGPAFYGYSTPYLASYVVGQGGNDDSTPTKLAQNIATFLNVPGSANEVLGITASSSGALLTISSIAPAPVRLKFNVTRTGGVPSETATIGIAPNGTTPIVLGGSVASGDSWTITVYDTTFGSASATHAFTSGDTLSTVADALVTQLNAMSGISASKVVVGSTVVINVTSTSQSATTFTKSTSGTATVYIPPTVGVAQASVNNVNELTSISAGGPTRFRGTTDRPVTPVTINSASATMLNSRTFRGNPSLSTGNNSVSITATTGGGGTTTNSYQVGVTGPSSSSLSYDANGNMTSDGTNSFSWDAENRLVKITYPGSGQTSTFSYDALGRNVNIVEAGSTSGTKQFVWCAARRCEERDNSGSLTKQFYAQGQRNGTSSYFYAPDHLGSVREMTNSSGTVKAEYSYSPYGERTVLSETVPSDFSFTGHYFHSRSELALTPLRAYKATIGRFINRDPIGERGGVNLYGYVWNSPAGRIDILGAYGSTGSNSGGASHGSNSGGGSGGSNSGGGSRGSNSKGSCQDPGWDPPGDRPHWDGPPDPTGWSGTSDPPRWEGPKFPGAGDPGVPSSSMQQTMDDIIKNISQRMDEEAFKKAFEGIGPPIPGIENPLDPTGVNEVQDEIYKRMTGHDAPEHPDPTQGTAPSDSAQRGAGP